MWRLPRSPPRGRPFPPAKIRLLLVAVLALCACELTFDPAKRTCTPKRCVAGGCGAVPDGCGHTLDCRCMAPNVCGGYGTPKVCGVVHPYASWPAPPDAPSDYADNQDGTVTDNVTGLVWEAAGGREGLATWEQAKAYCASLSLAGRAWRLPSRIELVSLVDFTNTTGPLIDTAAFPGTPGHPFWASSAYAHGKASGWYVDFGTGHVGPDTASLGGAGVRCVAAGAAAPAVHYTVHADTVLDNGTGLTWERAPSAVKYDLAEANGYCQTLGLDGESWRLPTLKELETIVDETTYNPAIDSAVFLGMSSATYFWSSSGSEAATAWFVNFSAGATANVDATSSYYVRCVR